MIKLNAKQLRTGEPDPDHFKTINKNPIYIILDNVLDTYNVGAIFRLADATACEKVYLCGQTETPPNPRIKKASINTWKWVDWEYVPTADDAINVILNEVKNPADVTNSGRDSSPDIQRGRNDGLFVIAVEQHKKSIPLSNLKVDFPVAVVVGNETYGVSKEVLKIADEIVELPMLGINKSLNVMVTLGIVLYKLIDF